MKLAVSLHAPNQAIREKIVPTAKAFPLEDIMAQIRDYVSRVGKKQRKVMFEYVMLAGVNLRCKIRSYLRPKFSANFTDFRQLERSVSRLYRSRFLQPNTHFAAFFEIY